MINPNKALIAIFLVRIFNPLVNARWQDDDLPEYADNVPRPMSSTSRPANENLPSYAEYLQRLKASRSRRSSTTTAKPIKKMNEPSIAHASANIALPVLPSIPLCKELPKEAGIYAHFFCWAMVALFAMSVISLIIYQLRSILWLKLTLDERKQNKKKPFDSVLDFGPYDIAPARDELRSNQQNSNVIGIDMPDLQRVLPQRSAA